MPDSPGLQHPVHVVVLAAGRGSRLAALGEETPKWLLDVGGRTIADRQLEGIGMAAEAVASVRVVVGHAAEVIERAIGTRPETIGVISNPEYATINNWWSLLRALRELPEEGPVAVIHADLLIEPAEVARFLAEAASTDAEALIAVDLERRLTDESMKVSLTAGGTLEQIGKVDVESPAGEFIGLLAARGSALAALRATLEAFVDRPEHANEWHDAAVGRTAADGVAWHIWPTSGGWVEIDDDADLRAAEALVGGR